MQTMDEIYRQYARTVYKYLRSLTRDADLAEELTQETFYQAIRSSNRYDGSAKITTWLCGIAKNVPIHRSGKRRRTPRFVMLGMDWLLSVSVCGILTI